MSHRQSSTTERNTMVSDREDGKEAAQRQVSPGQGTTTGDKITISHREDRKETAHPMDVCHRQTYIPVHQ